jgi:hypothetical protein
MMSGGGSTDIQYQASGAAGATPSDLSTDGASFSVASQQSSSPTPQPPGGSASDGYSYAWGDGYVYLYGQ